MQDNNETGAPPARELSMQNAIEEALRDAGHGGLPDFADVIFVAAGAVIAAADLEWAAPSRVEHEVRELVERHYAAQVSERGGDLPWWAGYQVAMAELANILEPGPAPMLPRDFGHAATCGVCLPNGDGVSKWSDR